MWAKQVVFMYLEMRTSTHTHTPQTTTTEEKDLIHLNEIGYMWNGLEKGKEMIGQSQMRLKS